MGSSKSKPQPHSENQTFDIQKSKKFVYDYEKLMKTKGWNNTKNKEQKRRNDEINNLIKLNKKLIDKYQVLKKYIHQNYLTKEQEIQNENELKQYCQRILINQKAIQAIRS
jgi:hypothetical protein